MNSGELLAQVDIIGLPVNREPQSKYSSRTCLQYAGIRLQNRGKVLILEPQATNTHDVLPNRPSSVGSGLGVTKGKTNSKAARLERGLWIQRYSDRETVYGAGARENPKIGRTGV
jgi:hypothetical protein